MRTKSLFTVAAFYTVTALAVLTFYAVPAQSGSADRAQANSIPTRIQHDKPGAEYRDGEFYNREFDFKITAKMFWQARKLKRHEASTPAHPLPTKAISAQELHQDTGDRLYRLGHSTVLMQLDGKWLLTDPVFSKRASPVNWAGSKRFEDVPVKVEDIPEIEIVMISHDHYDHLDKNGIKQLDSRVRLFIVPLKVGKILQKWGVAEEKIMELDWWQGVQLGSLQVTATPAQHYSGRTPFGRNKTLWSGYAIESTSRKIFFSGDSGYFSGLKEIGEYFGGFDYALLEVGSYNELWREIHFLPEDAIQANLDLNAKRLIPVHNGTFDMAKHAWWEPFETILAEAENSDIEVLMPPIGEKIQLDSPIAFAHWWRALMPEEAILTDLSPQQNATTLQRQVNVLVWDEN